MAHATGFDAKSKYIIVYLRKKMPLDDCCEVVYLYYIKRPDKEIYNP